MDEGGDFSAENIRTVKGEIRFDFVAPNDRINDVRLGAVSYTHLTLPTN
jgi:hypothetical protein